MPITQHLMLDYLLVIKKSVTSAWKSGPVRSFAKIRRDRDRDWSSEVDEPQKTGLNRHRPVQSGFHSCKTSLNQLWLRPVCNQSGPVL